MYHDPDPTRLALAFWLRRSVDLARRCPVCGTPIPSPEACPECPDAAELPLRRTA